MDRSANRERIRERNRLQRERELEYGDEAAGAYRKVMNEVPQNSEIEDYRPTPEEIRALKVKLTRGIRRTHEKERSEETDRLIEEIFD